jgi:hypothetical protein
MTVVHNTIVPSFLPLLEAPAEGLFWNLPEFGLAFDLMSYMFAKHASLKLIFIVRNNKKPIGMRSRDG